jgi:hypothetical protein
LRAYALTAARDVCRRLPDGVRHFRRIRRHYALGANNAVMGAEAGHPFFRRLLQQALELEPEERTRRYALGTGLLQDALATALPSGEIAIEPPESFYPLGPEMSEHWFRFGSRASLDDVLSPATRVVHWYASVRTRELVPRIEPEWVSQHASEQLLCALVQRALRTGEGRGGPETAGLEGAQRAPFGVS